MAPVQVLRHSTIPRLFAGNGRRIQQEGLRRRVLEVSDPDVKHLPCDRYVASAFGASNRRGK